jgi:hypothetical protein
MDRSLNPHPFAFPAGVHVRRHGPAGWADYRRYRPWLRDEFSFRCVYCLNRERWMDVRRGYQIDHFVPQKIRPDLRADYDNLLYLCAACNNLKGAVLLPDPCVVALSECICFHDDGTVEAIEPNQDEGQRLIDVLELDQPQLVEYRRSRIGSIKSHATYEPSLYLHEMGYPSELPDLTVDVPPRNTRPEGLAESCRCRFDKGTLPPIY